MDKDLINNQDDEKIKKGSKKKDSSSSKNDEVQEADKIDKDIVEEENLIFKAGDINRLEDIFKLYVDARKTKGCTWTEEYPTKEIIKKKLI